MQNIFFYFFQFIAFFALVAAANAGIATYGAQAILTPTITSQHQNTLRSYGNLGQVSLISIKFWIINIILSISLHRSQPSQRPLTHHTAQSQSLMYVYQTQDMLLLNQLLTISQPSLLPSQLPITNQLSHTLHQFMHNLPLHIMLNLPLLIMLNLPLPIMLNQLSNTFNQPLN